MVGLVSADLNSVFAQAFVEVLAPVYERLGDLEAELEVLKAVAWSPNIAGDIKQYDHGSVCGQYPKDLIGDEQWTPCDLPAGHDSGEMPTPHNCGLVL